MEYQRFGDRYQVRLHAGDELLESLTRLLESEGIGYAAMSGLGAVRQIELGYYDQERQDYDRHQLGEQMELLSLIGNATMRDGRPALHIHASLARRDLSAIGGHVFAAVANPTMEIWLRREAAVVERDYDDATHLALMQLPESLAEGR